MNTDCILKSVREALERDWRGIDGDFLPICVSQAAHALGVVCQIKFSAIDSVLVVQSGLGVGEAALARAMYCGKIILVSPIIT